VITREYRFRRPQLEEQSLLVASAGNPIALPDAALPRSGMDIVVVGNSISSVTRLNHSVRELSQLRVVEAVRLPLLAV